MPRYRFWNLCKWLRLGDFFYRTREMPDTGTITEHTQTDRMWRWRWGRERVIFWACGESMDRLVGVYPIPTEENMQEFHEALGYDLDIYTLDRSDSEEREQVSESAMRWAEGDD